MPFFAPWKERFEQGDLVYGLAEVRNYYALNSQRFANSAMPNIATIDQFAATLTERKAHGASGQSVPFQDDFSQAILKHAKYKSIFHEMGFLIDGMNAVDNCQNIRRKIKAGLHWAATDPRKFTVHFVLDEVNLEEVVLKSHWLDVPGHRSFTGVELRWIYRNRHDANVQRAIQFWGNNKPCCPPWDAGFFSEFKLGGPSFWARYVPSRHDE